MSVSTQLVEYFISRFVNCFDRYAKQNNDGSYQVRYEPITEALIRQHFATDITLAFAALDTSGYSKWCAWDADQEDGGLNRIDAVLRQIGLTPLLEGKRPGRDGHLWLLFDSPLQAASLRRFDREIRAHAKISQQSIEFFPKQDLFLKSGNPLRAPLGMNRKISANGTIGLFAEAPDSCLNRQLEWFYMQPLNDSQLVSSIVNKLEARESWLAKYAVQKKTSDNQSLDTENIFSDLDPEDRGDYYTCRCPSCEQRTAYFYEGGSVLICNRVNHCGFKVGALEYRIGKMSSQ